MPLDPSYTQRLERVIQTLDLERYDSITERGVSPDEVRAALVKQLPKYSSSSLNVEVSGQTLHVMVTPLWDFLDDKTWVGGWQANVVLPDKQVVPLRFRLRDMHTLKNFDFGDIATEIEGYLQSDTFPAFLEERQRLEVQLANYHQQHGETVWPQGGSSRVPILPRDSKKAYESAGLISIFPSQSMAHDPSDNSLPDVYRISQRQRGSAQRCDILWSPALEFKQRLFTPNSYHWLEDFDGDDFSLAEFPDDWVQLVSTALTQEHPSLRTVTLPLLNLFHRTEQLHELAMGQFAAFLDTGTQAVLRSRSSDALQVKEEHNHQWHYNMLVRHPALRDVFKEYPLALCPFLMAGNSKDMTTEWSGTDEYRGEYDKRNARCQPVKAAVLAYAYAIRDEKKEKAEAGLRQALTEFYQLSQDPIQLQGMDEPRPFSDVALDFLCNVKERYDDTKTYHLLRLMNWTFEHDYGKGGSKLLDFMPIAQRYDTMPQGAYETDREAYLEILAKLANLGATASTYYNMTEKGFPMAARMLSNPGISGPMLGVRGSLKGTKMTGAHPDYAGFLKTLTSDDLGDGRLAQPLLSETRNTLRLDTLAGDFWNQVLMPYVVAMGTGNRPELYPIMEVISTENMKAWRKATVKVWPAKPTLGDAIYVRLEIEAPAGVSIDAPFQEAGDQRLGRFHVVGFTRDSQRKPGGGQVQQQTYTLEAPSSGRHRVPPLRLEMVDARAAGSADAKKPQELLTDEIPLEVAPVPAEQASAQLKPAAGELDADVGGTSWVTIAGIGGGLLMLGSGGLLGYRAWIARRRIERQKSAYEEAVHELRILQDKGAPDSADADAWFVRLSSIVRRYLESRYEIRAPELTTEEFLLVATARPELTEQHRSMLTEFLERCDRVKFAGYRPDTEESMATLAAARAFVEETRLETQTLEVAA